MVLPPPAAHDESSAREAAYIEQIKLGLRLNRAGILIHVDQGRPEHLGKLVRALLPEHPELDVFTDVRAVTRVEPGSVLVLVPKPEDADWLNLNRPIFAQRKLAVIMYCDRQTTLALAERAVDFFDWVSQHHTAPDGPPDFAVQGFRKAVAANAPGIVWTGQTVEGLVRVFEAAFPGETLRWVEHAHNYEEFADTIRAAGDGWVACRIRADAHMHRFRLDLVKVGKRTRSIIVTAKPRVPGWWSVSDTCLTFEKAQSIFLQGDMRHPGRLAALAGLEKETLELAGELLQRGIEETDLLATLTSETDPGVALAKKAHSMGLVDLHAVGLCVAPAPLLRALDDAPAVRAWREALIKAVEDTLNHGDPNSMGIGVVFAQIELPFDVHCYWITVADWRVLLHEWNSTKWPLDKLDSLFATSSDVFDHEIRPPALELSAKTIAYLSKGKHGQALNTLAERRDCEHGKHRVIIDQLRARIWLDMQNDFLAGTKLFRGIEREARLNGPSTPLFAEFMVDLALLLYREGYAPTAFALLRKLLDAEWASLNVDMTAVADASDNPTPNAKVNDFVLLFLAQSNTPPSLPPESRARALRILAEVLLSQGRYEETEAAAQKAHETALSASEIARPEIWRALALHGRARALQGRSIDGKKDVERAIELATNAFGKTHAEVAHLWLDLARIQARIQDNDTTDVIGKAVDTWKHAKCDVKERDDVLAELQRLLP